MSKRSVNFLVGAIIIGLIAGITAYFVSPNFQIWVQVWLGRPDGLAASATTIAALATLFAVIVGLRGIRIGRDLAHAAYTQAGEAMERNQSQFLEAQYNASRPLLVPIVDDPNEQYEVEEPIVFDWNANYMFTTIQNVGVGIATNIWITFLPPVSLLNGGSQYKKQLGSPIASDRDPLKVYLQPVVDVFDKADRISEYSLFVPEEQAERFNARLCITYQDIFGRKHASISDLSNRGIWNNVAFLSNIERDLGQINDSKATKPVAQQVEA